MVDTSPINRVKGTNDILSGSYQEQAYLKQHLLDFFRRYGYSPLDTPVLEHSELYLRKSGEDIISRMYDFHYQSRRLCLRPEMTASIIRAYIDQMQEQPLPVRLCYSGQVFRYEKPQQARYRQFTQVGVELIGTQAVPDDDSPDPEIAPGVLADAELISIPCKALEHLGLPDYRLVIGDVGILLDFLRQIGLQGQMQNFLMLNMEKFRTEGIDEFSERIREINPQFEYNGYSGDSDDEPAVPVSRLTRILREMSEDDAREAVSDFLSSLNLRVDSTRDEVEIIDRLVMKIKQEDNVPRLNRAVSFMAELADLQGSPADVLDAGETELTRAGLTEGVAERVRELERQMSREEAALELVEDFVEGTVGDYDSREALDQAIIDTVKAHQAGWVIMAGWMRRVTQVLIDGFAGRILNIHPSVLPSFPGVRAPEQAIAALGRCSGGGPHPRPGQPPGRGQPPDGPASFWSAAAARQSPAGAAPGVQRRPTPE